MITRRTFFLSSTLAAARRRPKVLVCLVDGLSPAYIAQSEMPNFQRAARYVMGRGMMPSLTNVNNASLATGAFPERHGVTANTFFDPEAGKIVEMAAATYLRCPALFASARKKGMKTAFVGAKEKIRGLGRMCR
jgi:phosphonoacetate hydrolase